MKKLILIFALITYLQAYSQKDFHRKQVLSVEGISISYVNPRLYIDVKTTKPLQFQIWNGYKLVLNATNGMGEESFPVMIGRYKLILLEENGKSKTKCFRI
jgi:hypothetical protein